MKNKISFAIKGHARFIALFIFISAIPALSLYEVIATGGIDLNASGEGRTEYPMWLLYTAGWLAFLYILFSIFFPWTSYIKRGCVFTLTKEGIKFKGYTLKNCDVTSIEVRSQIVILTAGSERYVLHAGWTDGGKEALMSRFSDRIDKRLN